MPAQELPIRDLGVPVIIMIGWVLFATLFYISFVTTTWNDDPTQIRIAQVVALSVGVCTGVLTLGLLARRAGWTKQELDKWGDDMLSGKPPL